MSGQSKNVSNPNILNNRSSENDYLYDEEQESNYLDIWEKIPLYKDIKTKLSNSKAISILILLLLLLVLTYINTSNLIFSIIFISLSFMFFIIAFHDNFFYLRNIFNGMSRRLKIINPFEDFAFWMIKKDPATLLILNKNDAMTIGTRIFKIEILPENVHPTLNQFLQALNQAQVPFTYQVVQKPLKNPIKNLSKGKNRQVTRPQINNNSVSFQISLYFSVYYKVNGILTKSRLIKLLKSVHLYSKVLKSNFSANFHHTKITLLTGADLINSIRALASGYDIDPVIKKPDSFISNSNFRQVFLKSLFFAFIMVYTSLLLIAFNTPIIFIAIIYLSIQFVIIFLWWRSILYYCSNWRFRKYRTIKKVDPFKTCKFYRLNYVNDTLFYHLDNHLLLSLRSFNLNFATHPSTMYLDKFVRVLNSHKIPFIYTINAVPISYSLFCSECTKYLNEKTVDALKGIVFIELDDPDPKYVKYPLEKFQNWLNMRSGIWKTTLTISTAVYKATKRLNLKDFIELNEHVAVNSKILVNSFKENFITLKLNCLKNQLLASGFLSECFKNTIFRLNGTQLNYLYFQGKTLRELVKVVNEFKKGIETRIAAEFNTPTQLDNNIVIGKTINTEFLEEEGPLGFTFDQIKQLFITNGIPSSREHAKMKIVSELVKSNIPCVIFDYTGIWSKLIRFFKNSAYQDCFLHFKLGSSFSIDIQHSGIQYDTNNIYYLHMFYDVFALAFKEQKRNVEVLKETITKNEKLDLTSITLDLQLKQKWEQPYYSNSLLLLFKDFITQGQVFSKKALEYEDDINPIDFIRNDKTIIIDLSILKDLEKKTFVSFVILAKFIHFIENSEEYIEKVIVMPHIDLFFDSYYIDTNYNTANYGKIDKFLAPLLQKGFGLIFSANQVRYLHPHLFNYFRNTIALRATDARDIAVLKNQMNLQELQGTGYYSSKRNNTYQIDYLMNMKDDEIIVKRKDIYQPFPGIIHYNKLITTNLFTHEEILAYMENQGYRLRLSEKKILDRAKKTIFEKDFGIYIEFIDEIIHFLKTIKSIDNVGNLYRNKLKEELLKYINPKASRKVQDNIHIKEIRDELFDLLLKQDYLVESHPRKASGSEALRTSYKVGQKYEIALQDYYENQVELDDEINVEVMEREANTPVPFQRENYIIQERNLRKSLQFASSELYNQLFFIYEALHYGQYEKALKLEEDIIKKYFVRVYQHYYNVEKLVTNHQLNQFLNFLNTSKVFLLNKEELEMYIKKFQVVERNDPKELYDSACNFFGQIESYINKIKGE